MENYPTTHIYRNIQQEILKLETQAGKLKTQRDQILAELKILRRIAQIKNGLRPEVKHKGYRLKGGRGDTRNTDQSPETEESPFGEI